MASNTIFDLVQSDIDPSSQEGFFELAKRSPKPKQESFFNDLKEYGKSIVKGGIKGVQKLGRIIGPTQEHPEDLRKSQESLEKLFPTEKPSFPQRAIERTLEEIPTVLSFGGGSIPSLAARTALGSTGAEGAKSLGAPEWVQTLIDLGAFASPDVTKKLVEKGKFGELIKEGRKLGMSDEQLAPLFQSNFIQKFTSKLASKTGRSEKVIKRTKTALDQTYSNLANSKNAANQLSGKSSSDFLNEISRLSEELPSEARDRISQDALDLIKNPITGKSLMNFWADLNYYIGKGEKRLGVLKEPLKKAINSVDPELAKDFETINSLYTKYYPIADKLKPKLVDQFIGAAESLGILGGVITGNLPLLKTLVGEKTARILAREMLINPRFKQLGQKLVIAINENKTLLGVRALRDLREELEDIDESLVQGIPKLTEEEFSDLFNLREKQPK